MQRSLDDTTITAAALVALLERTAKDRPVLSVREIMAVLAAFNGFLFPRIHYCNLPGILAISVSEDMLQAPEAEPLRRDIEDGIDSLEMHEIVSRTEPMTFGMKLQEMSADAALALFVGARFWWGWKISREIEAGDAAEPDFPGSLGDYFNVSG